MQEKQTGSFTHKQRVFVEDYSTGVAMVWNKNASLYLCKILLSGIKSVKTSAFSLRIIYEWNKQ